MKRIITVLVVAVLLAVIVPAGLGCAETPSEFEVSGTMETISPLSLADPNPKIENSELTMRSTMYWGVRGGLEGVLVADFIMVIDTTTGKYTVDGLGTFTGEVEGKSGSYVCSMVGSGQFTSPGEAGEGTAEQTIISGTGELANLRGSLHGESRFDKETGMTSTYSGTLRFEE